MPAEAAAAALARQRRIGLRVAFAVAVGLTVQVANGAVIPFLGPLFAAQFLLAESKPLPLPKAIGMVGLVLIVGQAFILVVGLFGDRPLQLLALLGLFYFICFFAQAQGKGGPASFLCLVIAVMVPLLDLLQGDLDQSMIGILVQGIVSGIVLGWLAHAVWREPAGSEDERPVASAVSVENPAARAFANALILVLAVTICLTNSALSSAIVIPITVASLLVQLDLATSARAASGLVVVNLLGGVLASLAFSVVELRPSLAALFLVVLLVGLVLGGRAASPSPMAKVFAGALTTFLILFGTGISPLPASTPESFSTRIGFVLLAIAYTICMTALFWSRRQQKGAVNAAA